MGAIERNRVQPNSTNSEHLVLRSLQCVCCIQDLDIIIYDLNIGQTCPYFSACHNLNSGLC